MRVALAFNPISGSGRAKRRAGVVADALRAAGHEPVMVETRLEPPEAWLDPVLADCQVLLGVGGDGTIRMLAGSAAQLGTALYHVPLGTVNLFAKAFGMSGRTHAILSALDQFKSTEVDLGRAGADLFVHMASTGLDAEIVHDLGRRRTGAISQIHYLPATCRQFMQWKPPAISIEVDGETIVDEQRGMVVIANSRQYGWRLYPALNASMTDELLDVVFMPTSCRRQTLGWMVRCRLHRHLRSPRVVTARGKRVVVRSQEPIHHQIDGDRPPGDVDHDDARGYELVTQIDEAKLKVLLPAP